MRIGQGHGVEAELAARYERGEQGVFRLAGDVERTLQLCVGLARREPHEGVGPDVAERGVGLELGQAGVGALAGGVDLGGEVGVGRQVLQHRGDPQRMPGRNAGRLGRRAGTRVGGLHLQHIAERQVAAEIFAGHGAGDRHRIGLVQRGRGIAGQGGQGKDLEEAGIDPGEVALGDRDVPGPVAHRGKGLHQPRGDDPRHHRPELARDGGLGGVVVGARILAGLHELVGDLVDLLVARQPMVVVELAPDELGDQDGGGEGHRQAQDADRGIELVAPQVAERRGEIVAEHSPSSFRPRAGFPTPSAHRAD